jgi:hypothetical protein
MDFDVSIYKKLGGLYAAALRIVSILCGEVFDEEACNSRLQLL